MDSSYTDAYITYIQKTGISLNTEIVNQIDNCLKDTDLDNPQSSIDWNNVAVLTLIEAEQCDEIEVRSLYLSTAFEALNNGIDLDNHPLCIAHVALIHTLIGETNEATNLAFSTFVNIIHAAYNEKTSISSGLIYLPSAQNKLANKQFANLNTIFQAKDGYQQALLMLSEILYRSQLIFYNFVGLRLLNLNAHLVPESSNINLKLGISSLMCNQLEGLLYLHKAAKLSPDASIMQALYLAYRDIGLRETADFWLTNAKKMHQENSEAREWQWSNLSVDNKFTYVPFENVTMAVEPSFRSIVTGVLIAEGDWFEKEIEFWRSWLKPGMTVIDVGANVGVYTFSAASQVSSQGKVIAVEPFSGCVNCLQETCKINELSWVKVCQGAASDRQGTVRLSLNAASELNEIVDASLTENMQPGTFEEVSCFTLDSLITQESLSKVDFLKIDAEGHELQVLLGSDRLLNEFAPIILYENIAASQGSNLPVANYLIDRGYKLFKYKPFVQELIPLDSIEDLQGNLNIIALPQTRYES